MERLPVCVLNPAGRDPDQDFSGGPGEPGGPDHAPVNYHAYAACTGGQFLRSTTRATAAPGPVVLMARGDLRETGKALGILRRAGKQAWLAVKEAGRHQVAALLSDPRRLSRFVELVRDADGFLASTPWLVPFARDLGARRAEFIPTPYPVDVEAWRPAPCPAGRRGILVGTREFDVPSRNHLAAIVAALSIGRETEQPVTVACVGGRRDLALLRTLEPDPERLQIRQGTVGYADWLVCVASHELVFQLDRSGVPGQVAGDALLAATPCVGGDGAIEAIAWPELNGIGRSTVELQRLAVRLLQDSGACRAARKQAAGLADQRLSFAAVADQLHQTLAE